VVVEAGPVGEVEPGVLGRSSASTQVRPVGSVRSSSTIASGDRSARRRSAIPSSSAFRARAFSSSPGRNIMISEPATMLAIVCWAMPGKAV